MLSSVNQSQKPITTRINDSGNIEIGGCDVVELAKQYSTPLYVIDEGTLRASCRDYKNAFKDYPEIKMLYASKALCNSAIVKILDKEGFGFDTVSMGEFYTVLRAGTNMSKVLFNGNNKSEEELELAINFGIGRYSIDNFLELEILDKLAKQNSITVDVLLRITPGIECHTHDYIQTGHLDSKFGFDLSQIEDVVALIQTKYNSLNLKGLHAHIGSQIFELKVYEDEIEILAKAMKKLQDKFSIKLTEMNIGGGIGVKYMQDDTPFSVYNFANVVINKLDKVKQKYSLNLTSVFIEPGRSIISTSGVTLYSLGSSKQVPKGKKYFAINGGMADNPRPSMYQAKYYAQIANKKDEGEELQNVTIGGRFCESGDILIEDIELPNPQSGDILCVYNTGAYNYSMASNYNRVPKPPMVLVNNSQSDIIINKETLVDIISKDVIPNRLQ